MCRPYYHVRRTIGGPDYRGSTQCTYKREHECTLKKTFCITFARPLQKKKESSIYFQIEIYRSSTCNGHKATPFRVCRKSTFYTGNVDWGEKKRRWNSLPTAPSYSILTVRAKVAWQLHGNMPRPFRNNIRTQLYTIPVGRPPFPGTRAYRRFIRTDCFTFFLPRLFGTVHDDDEYMYIYSYYIVLNAIRLYIQKKVKTNETGSARDVIEMSFTTSDFG